MVKTAAFLTEPLITWFGVGFEPPRELSRFDLVLRQRDRDFDHLVPRSSEVVSGQVEQRDSGKQSCALVAIHQRVTLYHRLHQSCRFIERCREQLLLAVACIRSGHRSLQRPHVPNPQRSARPPYDRSVEPYQVRDAQLPQRSASSRSTSSYSSINFAANSTTSGEGRGIAGSILMTPSPETSRTD